MSRKTKPIRSDIAWSTHDRIEVHGMSLPDELLGKINLGDMAFLLLVGRKPTPQESTLFNAVAVTLVEHGITPSSIAARMTYAGAPEALQAAAEIEQRLVVGVVGRSRRPRRRRTVVEGELLEGKRAQGALLGAGPIRSSRLDRSQRRTRTPRTRGRSPGRRRRRRPG